MDWFILASLNALFNAFSIPLDDAAPWVTKSPFIVIVLFFSLIETLAFVPALIFPATILYPFKAAPSLKLNSKPKAPTIAGAFNSSPPSTSSLVSPVYILPDPDTFTPLSVSGINPFSFNFWFILFCRSSFLTALADIKLPFNMILFSVVSTSTDNSSSLTSAITIW